MKNNKKLNRLTPEEEAVIIHKATEPPFSGKYYNFFQEGAYLCKRCNAPLFKSANKFRSHCGWPSFDDVIEGAVKVQKDADGVRDEVICANCGAHLGHLFLGEGFTAKNRRYCINSISLNFIPKKLEKSYKKAYFAGGCFWGVEYLFEKKKGVIEAKSGYMGGTLDNPSYEAVCTGKTGHYETVEVTYDPQILTYQELAKYFFEIHDPTQANGQGPDIGPQYQSAIFYNDGEEKETAEKLINILKTKGYDVKTKLIAATKFWEAEDYHQDYYSKRNKLPYCHFYQKKF